jgi:hypothetical protein
MYVACSTNGSLLRPMGSVPGSFSWSSTGIGTEVVAINANDPLRCNAPAVYYVGVLGYIRDASYTITGRTGSAMPEPLTLGTPLDDVVYSGVSCRCRWPL